MKEYRSTVAGGWRTVHDQNGHQVSDTGRGLLHRYGCSGGRNRAEARVRLHGHDATGAARATDVRLLNPNPDQCPSMIYNWINRFRRPVNAIQTTRTRTLLWLVAYMTTVDD